MPSFRYRAMTSAGELVTGSLTAPNAAEVSHRIEYLGLIPIDSSPERAESGPAFSFSGMFSKPKAEDLTIFTTDLALLLRTGARIDGALELLSADTDIGPLRRTVTALVSSVQSGESFGEAAERHPDVFPPIYLALIKVAEASGSLAPVLEALSVERQRAEALRRRIVEAVRYPAFLFGAAGMVMIFFLVFVLPQFETVLKDANVKLDPTLAAFLAASGFLRGHAEALGAGVLAFIVAVFLALRRDEWRRKIVGAMARLPVIGPIMENHRATLFCRNLSLLLSAGVTLSAGLRILADIMTATGSATRWNDVVEQVRHGGKLSEALAAARALPTTAVRTLRLGEESGQVPHLAARLAEFYEGKTQRGLDRALGVAGPAAIILVSLVVGGLITSVMTALLSVNEIAN